MGTLVLRTVVVAVAILGLGWLGQGVRFGIAIWAVVSLPLYLTNSTIEPRSGVLAAQILAWGLVATAASDPLRAASAKGDSRILQGGTF
jgi:hypothetical protein